MASTSVILCVLNDFGVWEKSFQPSNSTVDWFECLNNLIFSAYDIARRGLNCTKYVKEMLPFLIKRKFNWFFFLSLLFTFLPASLIGIAAKEAVEGKKKWTFIIVKRLLVVGK